MIKEIRKKGKGFTLMELLLVLGIGSLAFMGFIQMEQKRQENLAAEKSPLQNSILRTSPSLAQGLTSSHPPV